MVKARPQRNANPARDSSSPTQCHDILEAMNAPVLDRNHIKPLCPNGVDPFAADEGDPIRIVFCCQMSVLPDEVQPVAF